MPVYFLTYVFVFWLPAIFLGWILFKTMPVSLKKSFWATVIMLAVVTTAMEYVYLYFDVWSFSEKTDKLLGIWFGPAPFEEFEYWYGAPPFCLTVYLAFRRLLGRKNA